MEKVKAFLETGAFDIHVRYFLDTRSEVNFMALSQPFEPSQAEPFLYAGFDPNYIYELMSLKAGTPEALASDLVDLAIIFVLRGNNVVGMQRSMSETGVVKLQALIGKYGIMPNISKGDRRKTITLSRIAMTFPAYAMTALLKLHGTYVPAQSTCLRRVHCLFRLGVASPYLNANLAPHCELLAFACHVVQGSILAKGKVTLEVCRRFFYASQSAPKLDEERMQDYIREHHVQDCPINWLEIMPELEECLSSDYDTNDLKKVFNRLSPILSKLIPPASWDPYTSGFLMEEEA